MIIAGANSPTDPATRRTLPRASRAPVPRIPKAVTPVLPHPARTGRTRRRRGRGTHSAVAREWHAADTRLPAGRIRVEFPLNGWRARTCLPAAHTFLPARPDHKGLPHHRAGAPERRGTGGNEPSAGRS